MLAFPSSALTLTASLESEETNSLFPKQLVVSNKRIKAPMQEGWL